MASLDREDCRERAELLARLLALALKSDDWSKVDEYIEEIKHAVKGMRGGGQS